MGTAAGGRATVRLVPTDVRFLATPGDLREWFDANHATAEELWLGGYRKASGKPSIAWSDAVDEALCVGWIDSVRIGLGDDAFAQRFTPRRKGSNWSAINVAKIARLTEEGRMRPAGFAAFEARIEARTGVYSYERPETTLTAVEEARFRANATAWADWERRPPSYRKAVLHWVNGAKRAETRERRIDALIEDSAAGRPIKPLRWARQASAS
jgi:uncharacterized protein YdeI (YjbR/CyaY-like superfamily)